MKKLLAVIVIVIVFVGLFYWRIRPMTPSLDRLVVFPDSFPKEMVGTFNDRYATLTKEVSVNPTATSSIQNWMEIGRYRMMINDYEGAGEVWQYVLKLEPNLFAPNLNLGDLYGYYLNDPKKAETYFLKALELGKEMPSAYQRVADFYRDVLHDSAKSAEILARSPKL